MCCLSGVGKSCITIQYVKGNFVNTYDPHASSPRASSPRAAHVDVDRTIEESYRKQTQVDEQAAMLEIVDTAGQEEFSGLREQWLRYGEGFFLVFSIISRSSFAKELEVIFRDMERVRESLGMSTEGGEQLSAILFGNKSDLERQRQVTTEEAKQFALQKGVHYFEGSALSNVGIGEAFAHLIRLIRVHRGSSSHGGSSSTVSPLMASKKAGEARGRGRGICTLL